MHLNTLGQVNHWKVYGPSLWEECRGKYAAWAFTPIDLDNVEIRNKLKEFAREEAEQLDKENENTNT